MVQVSIAAIQVACETDREANIAKAVGRIEAAAADGATLVVLPELFYMPYFCKEQDPRWFDLAEPAAASPLLDRFAALARRLGVVLPVSFFERTPTTFFNSLVVLDAEGRRAAHYRKSHIPDGPGYQEKFYFTPGDTGFRVAATEAGRIGAAVCWDQWFPEAARALALAGAEVLVYPTAIGSEPQDPALDSRGHWRRVMQGHAAANLVPVVAVNRVGTEPGRGFEQTFYGASFIAGPTGEILAEAPPDREATIRADIDLEAVARQRTAWGIFRDRRPDLYASLLGHGEIG